MEIKHGSLVISLDFELYWGARDKRSLEEYKNTHFGVKNAIIQMLQVFSEYEIHATWATVGFLFFESSDHLKNNLPNKLPKYLNDKFSPYTYLLESKHLEKEYHFAPELIELIQQQKGQEIGTHTFSHYYCLEEGQCRDEFSADLVKALKIAEEKGISIKSLVFPRNQWNLEYFDSLKELGLLCYRGNESSWLYQASKSGGAKIKRAMRLLDHYMNLSGNNTYDFEACINSRPYNFPSSRFLRPYSKKLAMLDGMRLKRITNAIDHAAKHNKLFHLWWHPHNFGVNIDENIDFLRKILNHFKHAQQTYGMKSLNMAELCSLAELHNVP